MAIKAVQLVCRPTPTTAHFVMAAGESALWILSNAIFKAAGDNDDGFTPDSFASVMNDIAEELLDTYRPETLKTAEKEVGKLKSQVDKAAKLAVDNSSAFRKTFSGLSPATYAIIEEVVMFSGMKNWRKRLNYEGGARDPKKIGGGR